MKRNRKDNAKKERIIMIASSAFVLTALTMTGIYMQAGDEKSQDDGYTLDFTAIEDNVEEKSKEIARNTPVVDEEEDFFDRIIDEGFYTEDDLDYMPLEAGSGNIEIPGVTTVLGEEPIIEEETPNIEEAPKTEEPLNTEEPEAKEIPQETSVEQTNTEPIIQEQAVVEQAIGEISGPELHFAESDGLRRPLEGEVLIPFNMGGSEYFSTLEVYKYNPALMLAAQEGTPVLACATGKVIDIFQDSEIGQAVTMDLGDGYQITYGQLKGLNVALNSYVDSGDMIASVAAPTKYFCVEGANLYLKLTLNGKPVDPEILFR
ncbi:MAG: M23 family metallopeptidase [Acetatifactor sp.]|nr:M23 family metallopeptidase [Acetatifactor sp.]